MRLSFITLFVSLLSLSVSVATNPQFLSRHDHKRSPVPSAIPSRQYHPPRSLLDLCINIRVNLFAGVGSVLDLESILGPIDLLSKVHLCLCLKDLDIYLATNSEIQSLIQLLGPNIVGSRIRAIINTSPQSQRCTFPRHAHHTCNTKDPCHWACDEGYIRNGDKCVCAPPLISCNDVCGLFPKGCSSAISRSFYVRTDSVSTLSQAKASCELHETVCGIAGREDSLAFECVDIALAKDSCGGCMTPHPFGEVDPIHGVSGQDCTRIPNVRSVGCSHSRCIVTTCQEGWVPNVNNTGCMVYLTEASGRLSKRSDPLSIAVTANTVVDSEILTQLVAVVDVVLHLSWSSSAFSANVTTKVSYGVSLLNDVNAATANLITSRTIRAFLQNIDHLLDVSSLLKSWLASCACVSGLGLSGLVEEINALVAAVAELRTFDSSHLVVSGPGSPTLTVLSPSATVLSDHPLVIRPSDLLSGLQLKGGVILQGLHDTNSLLSVLGLGPATPKIDSDLSNKIATLVHLVIALQDDLTSLPLDGRPSSVDLNLFVSIGQVTKVLLNATTVADVVSSLEHLVAVSNDNVQILENCGCIDSFGLQQLYNNLKHVLGVALEALTWCHSHPVVPGSNTPLLANKTIPVVVSLPDRLNHLALDSSGLITLGGGISNTNQVDIDRKPRNLVDPNLLSCLEVLVNLVATLHVSITLSTGQPYFGSAEVGFVKEMVDSLTCITPSTILADILISVNRILVAESSLGKALETCSDAGTAKDLVELLVKITKVTLQLGDLCRSLKPTLIHYSTATPLATTSRSFRIVPTRPASHHPPTSTTPFSVTVGRPTETRSLPTAVPTRPSLSNDEIIVSLNHLLSTLALGPIKGVTVEGTGHELNEPVNMLLDDLQIGPHDVHRREPVQGRLIHLTLQANVDALIDLFITLAGECGTRNCSNIAIPQRDFLDAILQQVVEVLTSTSRSKFVGCLDRLTTEIVDALKLLDDCECIADRKLEEMYRCMTEILLRCKGYVGRWT